MFRRFFIVAITRQRQGTGLSVIRTRDDSYTDRNIARNLWTQLESFESKDEEDYFMVNTEDEDSGNFNYMIENYELPTWLDGIDSMSETSIPKVNSARLTQTPISAILVLAYTKDYGEIMLFQNFSKANVIKPGRWIPLTENIDTYHLEKPDVLTFPSKLTAVYFSDQEKLLFDNYNNASRFLPLTEFFDRVSKFHIDEVFSHENVSTADKVAIENNSSSLIKRKFIKLNRLKTLDSFSVDYFREKAEKGGIGIPVDDKGKIHFPHDASLRTVLSFLTKDILEGPLDEQFYEVTGRKIEIEK